jgi:hypothetical protein
LVLGSAAQIKLVKGYLSFLILSAYPAMDGGEWLCMP